ncbi:MAG: FAD-dependent oxidoreductase [Lachnospiraceae bacterium]
MESIWTKQTQLKEREPLKNDIAVEAAVIGGGMAGILTAYFLRKKGIDAVVLEADRIGSGQTKNTTAKITLQHGAIYHKLIEKFGEEPAGEYARANLLAIEEYRKLIEEQRIACEFRMAPAYLYAEREEGAEMIKKEAKAAEQLGIRGMLTTDVELPFPVKAALKFEQQACFHPLRFLTAVAEKVPVYEHTQVIGIEERDGRQEVTCRVKNGSEQDSDSVYRNTAECKVLANSVVVATHYPIFNVPGYYFLRMHQERSYVLALQKAARLKGMYYSVEENGLSLRSAGETLLLGGGAHRTGDNTKGGQYKKLREAAKQYYPEAEESAAWSAQDCMTLDGVPYIGRYAQSKPNWYVSTGFGKWGMTSSMVTAMLLSEQMTGRNTSYEQIYSPQRFVLSASAKMLMEETVEAAKGLTKRLMIPAGVNAGELALGEGKIIDWEGEKLGAYRDETGELFLVSAKCQHLGCQLEWNPEEKSFDCPCHGSRFRYTGELIDNPAQEEIGKK